MKINKETRQLSKELLRASFTDGQLDSGRISSLVKSLIEKKPRHYIQVLEAYKRLLRLEVEKRTATIETATELPPDSGAQIVANRANVDASTMMMPIAPALDALFARTVEPQGNVASPGLVQSTRRMRPETFGSAFTPVQALHPYWLIAG